MMLRAEAFSRLVERWETVEDQGRQFLARDLFDATVFDLAEQGMTNFKLKPWAERFLVVRDL